MADNRRFIQAQKFTLAVGISTTDTSITLQSFNFPDGTAIAAGDLGTINYGTLEPGTSREESISFTGFTTNLDNTVTLTGVTRGLGFGAVDTYSEQADLKSQHGTGAIFILSNTAAFYNDFVNKNNDEEMLGTLSVQTPTSANHAATKQYVDENVSGGAVSNDRIVQAATAGESLAEGDLVYFDDTDNEWKRTVATIAATLNNVLLGIAQGAGSDGGTIDGGVLTYGLDSTQTGLTPGVKLYAGDTAGAIVETAGTVERVIGWSKSATEIYFDANVEYTPTASEKDAMSGGDDFGTPSASNKFLTEEYFSGRTLRRQYDLADSPATWTKQNDLKYIIVEAWGGGGNGATGGATASRISAGGGGGYTRKRLEASELGATETVTVGGSATNSTFGSLVTGYRGGNGSSIGISGTVGGGGGGGVLGAGGNGNIDTTGQAGSPGYPVAGLGAVLADNRAGGIYGGGGGANTNNAGGNSLYGGGGGGHPERGAGQSAYGGNGGAAGANGSVPGGGGGTSIGTAGVGGAGRVIVTEYYS